MYHFGRKRNYYSLLLVPRLHTYLHFHRCSWNSTAPPAGAWKICWTSHNVVENIFMGFCSRISLWYSPSPNSGKNWWPSGKKNPWSRTQTIPAGLPPLRTTAHIDHERAWTGSNTSTRACLKWSAKKNCPLYCKFLHKCLNCSGNHLKKRCTSLNPHNFNMILFSRKQ